MSLISDQLASAPVTDSLKHAAQPGSLTLIPWALTVGSWSEATGWSPPGFSASPPTGDRGGLYLNTEKLKGGRAYNLIRTNTFGHNAERQYSLYVFSAMGAKASGYQVVAYQASSTANIFTFKLRKWTEGVLTTFKEVAGVEMEAGAFALVVYSGKVSMWMQKTEASPWTMLAEVMDHTFQEGYSGFAGNGSNPKLTNFSTGVFSAPAIAVTRSYIPDQLAVRIDAPNGTSNRWAEDEPLAENVLSDIEISDEIPGGYKDMQGTLARDPQHQWNDLEPYSEITVYEPGDEIVWQGFLDKTPDVSGEQLSIAPSGLGWQSALEDNQAVQVGFIDSDLSKWGEPSTQRRANVIKEGRDLNAFSVSAGFKDAGAAYPGISFATDQLIAGAVERGEQWYYGGGVSIGEILYDFVTSGGADAEWLDRVTLSSDDIGSSSDPGTDHNQTTALEKFIKATVAGRRYALVEVEYGGVTTGTYLSYHDFRNLRVLGQHGLTLQGAWPFIGFTAKQMLGYLINNFASPLYADDQFIDDDGFLIPQAWYGDPASVAMIAKDIIKYGLYDWFVYTGKRFEYRQPGTYGRFWKANVGSSNLNELGMDSQRLWRSIVVQYQDVDGSTKTVGPLGSGCNVESTDLEITDPQHPAVQAGRTRQDILDLQGIGTPASAIEVGKRFLEEANLLNRSGSATLTGYVLDDKGIFRPAAQVRSGDWISFVDAADTSYRKIVNKTYRHNERSAEIDLDAPASGLEALLERLQAGLISLGVS